MKILRVSLTYPRVEVPGVGLPCFYHANYSKHSNLIITLKMKGQKIPSKADVGILEFNVGNKELGKIKSRSLKKYFAYFMKLFHQTLFLIKSRKAIKEFNPDVVHIYSPIPLLIGLYCKKVLKTKFVMSLHGTDVERIKNNRILQNILLLPDEIVCVSDSMITRLNGVKTNSPIHYIGNGFESEVFDNKQLNRKKQFVNVGNLRWQKGHKYLLEAFAEFIKSNPEYLLILIGDGPDKQDLLSQINCLGIEENVEFKGILSRREIANILNESEAFILSSVLEGFPKVILESMGTGTPVISTDVGNVAGVIKDSGLICQSENSHALAKKMFEFKTCNWMELSKKAEKIAVNYTWDSVSERLEKFYLK